MLAVEPNSWAAVELWRSEGRRRADRGMIGAYCCPAARLVADDDGRKTIFCAEHGSPPLALTALGLAPLQPDNFVRPTEDDAPAFARIVRGGVVPAVAPER
jgi:hypothetical protein